MEFITIGISVLVLVIALMVNRVSGRVLERAKMLHDEMRQEDTDAPTE